VEGLPVKLISISQAARLLGLAPSSLRRHECPDGRHAEIYGQRIRVWRTGLGPKAQRRYDEDEIRRVLARMARAQ
jgi:hypothetical protein